LQQLDRAAFAPAWVLYSSSSSSGGSIVVCVRGCSSRQCAGCAAIGLCIA
jgi:hypothetical protein